jgi:dCTP deaminase
MILRHDNLIDEVSNGKIHCVPFDQSNVGPNSIDVHLADYLVQVLPNTEGGYIDPELPQLVKKIDLPTVIQKGRLYLGATVEAIGSDNYVPMLDGRSSIGRLGLAVHISAGFGDIGFKSPWTLEITCVEPVMVRPGMRIAQVFFETTIGTGPMYRGRYEKQTGPEASKYGQR